MEDRETMIEWCGLLSGYSNKHFEKMSDEGLKKEYEKLMGDAAEKIEQVIK